MKAFNFKDMIVYFQDIGIYDVMLPFLLIFTVIYAFLQKTMILGFDKDPNDADKKIPKSKFNMVVALILGLVSIRIEIVRTILTNALPKVSVTIVGILMVFILVSMFTGKPGLGIPSTGLFKHLFLWGPAIVVAYYFLSDVYNFFPAFEFIREHISTIIVIAVFGIVIGMITSDTPTKEEEEKKKEKREEEFKKLFKLED